ncbi:hypothetical protein TrispH2_003270 [Trichoplax sp. H2]|nr:hypothetical protein TrispH2_003270 [Trichoplax sp. H2]|eukprot:RDD44298.1 hypothetical protein TrispH2_003270 [Trichoplax sp. H2]
MANNPQFKLGILHCNSTIANAIFAILSIIGQLGQSITLPLWIDSTIDNSSFENTDGNSTELKMDSYFVLTFSLSVFFLFFGSITLFLKVTRPEEINPLGKLFPSKYILLVASLSALDGLLIVYSSSGTRTPPHLQAILQTVVIPLTILFRPTLLKFICAGMVLVALFVCLIPTMFTITSNHQQNISEVSNDHPSFIWPIIYITGLIPGTISIIFMEASLKLKLDQDKTVNIFWFLTWVKLYQLVIIVLCFWTDFLPHWGDQPNIEIFAKRHVSINSIWVFSISCFFGGSGCSPSPGVRGTIFMLCYILNFTSSLLLIQYSEGAALAAMVSSVVTPLNFLFWTLFNERPFQWHPHLSTSLWFSIGGLCLMFPAILIYNFGEKEKVVEDHQPEERKHLLEQELRDLSNAEQY